jgi:hypothetical protein
MTPGFWLRHLVWSACILALVSAAEASNRVVTADFDGDGHTDSVSIDRAEPSILHVRLSRSGTVTRIRRARPVLYIVARDLDGDRLPELITTEDASTSGGRWLQTLRVWTPDGSAGFRKYHPRRRVPRTLKAPWDQRVDEGAPVDDAMEALGSVEPSRESTTTRDPVATDVATARIVPAPHPDAALVPAVSLDLATPRAPPA